MDDTLSISSSSISTVNEETIDGLTSDLTLINELKDMAHNQFKKFMQLAQPFATTDQLKNKFEEINCNSFQRFENESQSTNPKVINNLKQSLAMDLEKIYQLIRADNERQRKQYLDTCQKRDDSSASVLSVYLSRNSLIGAIFDDKLKNLFYTLSPNCIAFKDEVLIGKEAKDVLKNSDFDIKKLFVSDIKDLSEQMLNFYPFEYLSVNGIPKANFKNICVTIESLIGLQILDIKSKAEKQLSINVSKGVFVVPHCYLKQNRDKFEKLSICSGLESVKVLSEITAAAIGFAKPDSYGKQLIVSVNGLMIDWAIVEIKHESIKYEHYWKINLDLDQSKKLDINARIEESINTILTTIYNLLSPKGIAGRIDKIILTGYSNKLETIRHYLFNPNHGLHSHKIVTNGTYVDKCGHLVSTGAAVYAKYEIEGKQEFKFNIFEMYE